MVELANRIYVSDEIWKTLNGLREPSEKFEDVIRRLLKLEDIGIFKLSEENREALRGSLTPSEHVIAQEYEDKGYIVIHVGVPDFICLGPDVTFIEVKKDKQELSRQQKLAIALLRKYGFGVHIRRASNNAEADKAQAIEELAAAEVDTRTREVAARTRDVSDMAMRLNEYAERQLADLKTIDEWRRKHSDLLEEYRELKQKIQPSR